MKNNLLYLVVAISTVLILFLWYSGRDTRTMIITISSDSLAVIENQIIEKPIRGYSKNILEILETKSEPIEIRAFEVLFGGIRTLVEVKERDGSTVHYDVFVDRIYKTVSDREDRVTEQHWYLFTENEFDEIQSLINKLSEKTAE